MTLQSFPCTKCGQCCRNVHLADQTKYLDRGDGSCINYCDTDKLCLVYNSRPDICRIDLQYQIHYSSLFSWEDFVEVNANVCRELQG